MTIAVIKTGGKQYIVSEGQKLKIEKINQNEGEEFEFDKVLLFVKDTERLNGEEVKIGQPLVDGVKVRAKVLKEGRGEKKIVFRYKNKTRYKKKKGHRQSFTEVEILSIS
ncbi:MAG: 50S ribosomal protein L21 [Patescibacteria group bacterium]